MTPRTVAALFVRRNSHYKTLAGVDCYDEDRNALSFTGGYPVIAHPPCRGWGRLRKLACVRPGELDLAFFALDAVRSNGGILEHPAFSLFWSAASLPVTGFDSFGGFTLPISQRWFGHRAEKLTWLYIVGIRPSDLPAIPLSFQPVLQTVENMGRAERERTPLHLSCWLTDVARMTNVMGSQPPVIPVRTFNPLAA